MAQPSTKDEGRAEFVRRAAEAYDRMMKEDQEQMITFEQMDNRAVEAGGKLQCWLLEQRLELAVKRKAAQPSHACPVCGKPLTMKPPEERHVLGRAGKVPLRRPLGYCASCRKHFSPGGRAIEAERGGL